VVISKLRRVSVITWAIAAFVFFGRASAWAGPLARTLSSRWMCAEPHNLEAFAIERIVDCRPCPLNSAVQTGLFAALTIRILIPLFVELGRKRSKVPP